jgi:hypothetical protein
MRLYVANVTKQTHIFNHWRMGIPKLQEPSIKPGTQICIEGERPELEHIVGQHRRYGIAEASQIEGQFSGIAYQFDKPVNVDALQRAVVARAAIEDDRSQQAREAMAASVDQQMQQAAHEVGLGEVKTVIEIQEKQTPEGAALAPAAKQTITVDRNAPAGKRARKN